MISLDIPEDKGLTHFHLIKYTRLLQLKDFRYVIIIRDNLPQLICGVFTKKKHYLSTLKKLYVQTNYKSKISIHESSFTI